jgi:hypothetical protein
MGKGDFALPSPPTLQKSGNDVKGTNAGEGGGKTFLTHTLIPPNDNNTNHISYVNKKNNDKHAAV